ncbi:MAG: carbon storage regulator CsrA [Clostridiales bacterium]|jgi:carbon storage regulator|nr:carbon storage regulator CsrA [Clostridiales bacterium]
MLVLTRKQNEGILIGNDIVITVINIEGDKIRLGIEAPKNVRVIREELLREIGQENRMAAQSEYRPIRKKPFEEQKTE